MIRFNVNGKRGLAITEKPSLTMTIKGVFDKHKNDIPYSLDFVTQRGHLLTMLKPDEIDETFKEWSWDMLPITANKLGGWHYKVTKEKKVGKFLTSEERYSQIYKAIHSGNYDFIVHIGDPDREGQLLVDLVLEKAKNKLPVMRYWQNALTEEKILETLLNLKSNDEPFFQNTLKAGKARQHIDYLVGMNLSRAATIKMQSRVSIGRVKTVLLGLICKRELEIRHFTPETVYGVRANYDKGFSGTLFLNDGVDDNGKVEEQDVDSKEESKDTGTIWFNTKEEAERFIADTSNSGVVTDYITKRTEQLAPKFYNLGTLQVEAGRKFGYKANKTLEIAQSLYEAQLTTYPRSDCEYISSTEDLASPLKAIINVPNVSSFLKTITKEKIEKVRKTKKWINDKQVDDSGHTAIIPTKKVADLSNLNQEQRNIYEMIAKRYLAAFLPPLVQDTVKVVVTVDGDKTFRSTGKTLVSLGYAELFERVVSDVELPVLNKGDSISISDFDIPEKTTQIPKRYTSSELVAVCQKPNKYLEDVSIKNELKKLQIGTEATLSDIIEDVVRRDKYATWEKEGKREVMKPNQAGEEIYNNLSEIDFSLLKIDTTGHWEITLKDIVSGDASVEKFEQDMDKAISEMIEEIKNSNMKSVSQSSSVVKMGNCLRCGGEIIQTDKSFFCSNYKENGCMSGGYRNIGGHILTAGEFNQLQKGEEIVVDAIFEEKNDKGKVVSKRKYRQRIGLNDKGTITPIKNKSWESQYTCPACHGKIIEADNAFICSNRQTKECNVYLNKITQGVALKESDISLILTGSDSTIIKGLVSIKDGKKGNPYNAILYVDKINKKIAYKSPSEKTDYACPVCQKGLEATNGKLICSGYSGNSCSYQMYTTMYKKALSKEKIEKMLDQVRSGEISGGVEAFITKNPVETSFTCPYCSSQMNRNGVQILCSSCDFSFYRVIGDEMMTDEDISNLLIAGKTGLRSGLISSKGTPYSARQTLDFDNKKLVMEYVQEDIKTEYDCPICSSKIAQSGLKMSCSSCGFVLWTNPGGIKLTKGDIDDFFTKHVTKLKKMKKKDGTSFEAKIAVDFENKKSKFIFPTKK